MRVASSIGIALGTGGAVGFLLGGWLVTLDPVGLGWRGISLVNLPIGALVTLAAHLLMPPLPTGPRHSSTCPAPSCCSPG
jgi:MFS family permease